MTIKTCEEYVLNELNNEISKNERLTEEVEELDKKNKELKEQNGKLMDLIKIFIKEGKFERYGDNKEYMYYSLVLYSHIECENKIMEELIKIKEQLENE